MKQLSKLRTGEKLRMFLSKSNKFSINTDSTVEIIGLDELMYIKSDGNYCTFLLQSGKSILVSKSLKQMENRLSLHVEFMRTHNSFMVNLNYVVRMTRRENYALELRNGAKIPVSRRKNKIVQCWITGMCR